MREGKGSEKPESPKSCGRPSINGPGGRGGVKEKARLPVSIPPPYYPPLTVALLLRKQRSGAGKCCGMGDMHARSPASLTASLLPHSRPENGSETPANTKRKVLGWRLVWAMHSALVARRPSNSPHRRQRSPLQTPQPAALHDDGVWQLPPHVPCHADLQVDDVLKDP